MFFFLLRSTTTAFSISRKLALKICMITSSLIVIPWIFIKFFSALRKVMFMHSLKFKVSLVTSLITLGVTLNFLTKSLKANKASTNSR